MNMKRWKIGLPDFYRVLAMLLLAIFTSASGSSQETTGDGATVEKTTPGIAIEDMTPEQRAMATIKLTSPRNTLTTFLQAMNAIEGGKEEYWIAALECIYLKNLDPDEQISVGKSLARNLHSALKTITLKPDSIVGIKEAAEIEADDSGETNHSVELGEEKTVPITFNLNSDGFWRINRTVLAAQVEELGEIVEQAEAAAEVSAAAEEENISRGADGRLSNPRKTMRTFLEAFKSGYWEKGGREDAIATLDLSDVPMNLKTEKGEEFAAQLKNILDRDHVIVYEEIAQEYDAAPQEILVDPLDTSGRRRIVLAAIPIEEGSEVVEWKFTKESLAILNDLWDTTYKDRQPIAGFQSEAPKVMALQLRDWMNDKAPFLMNELFLFENWKWLGLLFSIMLGMVVSRFATFFLVRIIRRVFSEENMRLDEKLERDFIRPIRVGIMAWVWWLALKPLSLPGDILSKLKIAITTVSCMAFVWGIYRLVDILGTYITKKALLTENKYDDMIVPLIVRSLKLFIICVGAIWVLEMNNFETVKILAGFGLFGMAMALAAKDTLGNIFGSLTVLMDRPFEIGDWVQIGDVDGSVEQVGIRSTRVRTFYNSVVTVPNALLTNAVIDNYGARRYRRYKTTIGVTYDTPPEKIDAFCEGIRELIRQHPYTRKDYFHVYLNDFGASSLDIMLYCFHECPDWSTELRERHRLMTDIIRLAKSMGVEFAFPTSTLYMKQVDGAEGAPLGVTGTDALLEGRRQATQIVDEQMGKNAPVPPPVTFDAPPGSIEDMTGDEDGDS